MAPPLPGSRSNILYERILPDGLAIRIRLTTDPAKAPVRAVLEIDRRTSSARPTSRGIPPRLVEAEAESVDAVVSELHSIAASDDVVRRLMSERGLR